MTNAAITTQAPVKEVLDLKKLAAADNYYLVTPTTTYPELEPFKHVDVGHRADPKKASLYDNAEKIFDLTPNVGTEIHGIQLSKLTNQQKDDLALLIAERGVVFFKKQDINIVQGEDLGRHYGPLHIHNIGGHPPNHPYVLPIYSVDVEKSAYYPKIVRASEGWHTDVSYELQPPGFTFLKIDTLPSTGGDTLWSSSYAAYDKLSPALQKFFEGLEVVHSGKEQAEGAVNAGIPQRRQNVLHTHPLVRTHPVTGLKALYIQPGFARSIVGLSKRESDTILNFLYEHLAGGYDFQVRFKWEEDTVAVWDNRVTSHCAIFDYLGSGKRHGWRITTQAERPYFDPNSKSRAEVLLAQARSKK
ncbi:hypothetical protein PHYBLDRAFT_143110 [Phycomyces blakesleeanus NRRL 1555(-)]|uniref:TauD/TfdA-like domain-containing protein n=1 Tax=Phycomyces blakesleeanus (strain ATCC 8743b / DSM 1359 / FGSC 10004 / NBRC 33097 / NRRL 1555) TaxID=763407 RepID=A0A162PUL3_PHYB8|nr:hypothetical protein PHYBLDRAFT_143110 [Phycomyces blakesleeanus NRRL 1555(-)]OAD76127.1 hypothetical protein PHYBLDRAFT_143110 [Phycomyces blakesleeanus NRRL 1555(-)]|eukprot:XP_018294167.1 hypothetical protein PHYBLDRAFT_143110 [Phycomyces blakesleeanus NRRL 1555(-)]